MQILSIGDCDQALRRILSLTLRRETLATDRDIEVLKIQRQYEPRLQKAQLEIASLEAEIQAFYEAHREEIEQGKKSVQLAHGNLGMRAPAHPALVPLSDDWTWEAISTRLKAVWKSKFFHKPKPPGIDKVKIKGALSAEQLADCGLRLDEAERFFYELNRLAVPDESSSEAA